MKSQRKKKTGLRIAGSRLVVSDGVGFVRYLMGEIPDDRKSELRFRGALARIARFGLGSRERILSKLPEHVLRQCVSTVAPSTVHAGGALGFFAWFTRGEIREAIRASSADLRKDVRAMRKENCGRWHILAVRFWITTTTIVPILWDGCVRISKKLPMLGSAVRAVSALLRKIDPPRLG
ncbi:MAG: hypothetical protein IPK26_02995 [Planctomycetes bacterium]|nr:hypothetical protein [Planctomycetota bacterium]